MLECKKCGKCCEFLLLEVADNVTDDFINWCKLHEVEILRIDNRWFARINNRCVWLIRTEECNVDPLNYPHNFRCKYHGLRPQMCKDFHCEDPKYRHVKHLLQ
jgi:Fe-S-cluster containining protein